MLGRLHFRTSYSQNVLRHSVEVAFLAGMLAEEIGLDGELARRCGLLHDIGKAADHELEGGHPKIGADLLKRYGERPEVVHAALGHHDDIVIEYPYTVLVADGRRLQRLAARGAPRDAGTLHQADGGAGDDRQRVPRRRAGFAIQAGRELRVHGQRQGDRRRQGGQDLPRHRQGLRGAADLSRRDQGDRAARVRASRRSPR